MRYTLWSQGRLLGESQLDYARYLPTHRMGDLTPTSYGERILPAVASAGALELRGPGGRLIPTRWIDVRDTEYLRSLIRADAIALEDFRDLFGGLHPDVDEELALDDLDALDDVDEADELVVSPDERALEPWEAALPRYQLQVLLEDDASVP